MASVLPMFAASVHVARVNLNVSEYSRGGGGPRRPIVRTELDRADQGAIGPQEPGEGRGTLI